MIFYELIVLEILLPERNMTIYVIQKLYISNSVIYSREMYDFGTIPTKPIKKIISGSYKTRSFDIIKVTYEYSIIIFIVIPTCCSINFTF